MTDESTVESELARVVATLRDVEPADLDLTAPPASVWDGIVEAVRGDAAAAPVVDLSSRRRRAAGALLAAAAVVVLVVAGAAVLLSSGDGDVIARAELAHDAATFDELGREATARVELVGGATIRLADAALPTELGEADLELWLIEADEDGQVVDLVSLGIVGEGTEFTVPAGYDPSVYSVVDISVEPRDGEAAHSGRSILRGPLVEA